MVFSSPTFLFVFLPAVLVATWVVPRAGRKLLLLGAGALFYAWGVQEFIALIFASTLVDWALARGIARCLRQSRASLARALLVAGILQNLALLGWFKYAGWFAEQADAIARLLGGSGVGTLTIALPIGISFFTFEKVSYLVDVWRGDVAARRSPLDILLFVSLFPRAIAGPIVRLREIQHDLADPRPRADQVQEGAVRFAHGLIKKVLIADQIAPVADAAFASAADGSITGPAAWIGLLAYALQIYFDFSGYSDMAIGIAMMLGFRLPENFARPYSALSVTDFWRRWHMTLSRWFRDYVYIPLGGSRGSLAATYRNLMVVFLLVGVWHGAGWTFVLWGLYHGTWLLVERVGGLRATREDAVRSVVVRRATTFLIVALGWVLFRADDLGDAGAFYRALAIPGGGSLPLGVRTALDHQALVVLCLAALVVLLPRTVAGGRWIAETAGRAPALARAGVMAVGLPLALIFAMAQDFSPFLYFRF